MRCWVRYKHAGNGSEYFFVGDQFRGVLHNYLRYVVDPGTDENMSRWPMADYWAELINGIQRISCWTAPGMEFTLPTL